MSGKEQRWKKFPEWNRLTDMLSCDWPIAREGAMRAEWVPEESQTGVFQRQCIREAKGSESGREGKHVGFPDLRQVRHLPADVDSTKSSEWRGHSGGENVP